MRRKIQVEEAGDHEGLCYDPTIALQEGLYEEMVVNIDGREIRITDELFDAILNATDLAVNVGPDERQGVVMGVSYIYGYGQAHAPLAQMVD